MSYTAVICEKSSQMKELAASLGWKRTSRGYEGTVDGRLFIMDCARGHLLRHQTPDEVDPTLGWNQPLKLTPLARKVKQVIVFEDPKTAKGEPSQQRLAAIEKLLQGANDAVICTDPDREGEAIGWDLIEWFNFKGNVERCWLDQGYDEVSALKAFRNLLPASAKKSGARAAEARSICDRAYMYIVRLLSYYGQRGLLGNYLGRGQGREAVVSAGRVQTSALYMIYRRELEIEKFVPKTYFKIFGDFSVAGVSLKKAEYEPKVTQELIDSSPEGVLWEPQGSEEEKKLDKPYFIGKPAVEAFKARILVNADKATVLSYKEDTKLKYPPKPWDLTALQSELSETCGVSSEAAQAIIEDLYGQGYTSYPRTAHGDLPDPYYSPNERDTRLRPLMSTPGLEEAAAKALAIHSGKDTEYKAFKPKCYVTKKLEHWGIIPTTRKVDAAELSRMTAKLKVNNRLLHTDEHMRIGYQLVAKRYIESHMPPATFATQKIVFSVPVPDMLGAPETRFKADSERLIDPGYLKYFPDRKIKSKADLPKLKNGSPALVEDVPLEEGVTRCPGRYSEAGFPKAMHFAAREVDDPVLKKYMNDGSNKPQGIGTPATRKEIIPTLLFRGYVSIKNKQFYLEPKGRELIEFFIENNLHSMYRIETTAEWEAQLATLIEHTDDNVAKAARDRFVDMTLTQLEEVINLINSKFSAKIDAPRLAAPLSTVTPKVKEIIQEVCKRKGIKVPSGALSDPKKAQAFLDEHGIRRKAPGEAGGAPGAPSDAQIDYVSKIEAALGIKIGEEDKKDRSKVSAFIETHKTAYDKAKGQNPPTQAMINFAKKIIERLADDQKPGPEVLESYAACKQFLDKHAKDSKSGSSSGGSAGSKSSGGSARGSARPGSGSGRR